MPLPVLVGAGKQLEPPRSIVITGASTGFGEALALHYAKPGVALALTARSEARLKTVANACMARYDARSTSPPFSLSSSRRNFTQRRRREVRQAGRDGQGGNGLLSAGGGFEHAR
jgi:NAD(P)-dependent dehydrogenase (short-subunit alcohol dehydrogenase family)